MKTATLSRWVAAVCAVESGRALAECTESTLVAHRSAILATAITCGAVVAAREASLASAFVAWRAASGAQPLLALCREQAESGRSQERAAARSAELAGLEARRAVQLADQRAETQAASEQAAQAARQAASRAAQHARLSQQSKIKREQAGSPHRPVPLLVLTRTREGSTQLAHPRHPQSVTAPCVSPRHHATTPPVHPAYRFTATGEP